MVASVLYMMSSPVAVCLVTRLFLTLGVFRDPILAEYCTIAFAKSATRGVFAGLSSN